MSDLVERLAGWENKGHDGDPMTDMLMDDVGLALGEIRRLQSENQALRAEVAEAKLAIEWATTAERESCAALAEDWLSSPEGGEVYIARQIVDAIRARSERGLAAAFPFQTEEAKEA